MDDKASKPKYVTAGGKIFPKEPGLMDRVKEGFQDSNTRAQLDAIRRRQSKLSGSNG